VWASSRKCNSESNVSTYHRLHEGLVGRERNAPWPVDEEGLPTIDYLNTLNTKAKWERFWKVANERSQLQLWHPSVC
jgi:hypothetical protein